MGTAWTNAIKSSGQLRVKVDRAMSAGWRNVSRNAIREVNRLARQKRLGVSLQEVRGRDAGDAEVVLATASGAVTARHRGRTIQNTVSGVRLHGLTVQVKYQLGSTTRMERAFCYFPTNPMIQGPGARGVGDGVKLVIAAHELIHALGPEDGDHDHGGGLFQGYPSLREGANRGGDRVTSGHGLMPPLWLSSTTVGVIQGLWS